MFFLMRKFEVLWREFIGCVEFEFICFVCIIGWCGVELIKVWFIFWLLIFGVKFFIFGVLWGLGVNGGVWGESGCVGFIGEFSLFR